MSTIAPSAFAASLHDDVLGRVLEAVDRWEVFPHEDGNTYIDVTGTVERARAAGLLTTTTDHDGNELWTLTGAGDHDLACRRRVAPYALLPADQLLRLAFAGAVAETTDPDGPLCGVYISFTANHVRAEVTIEPPAKGATAARKAVERIIAGYGRNDVSVTIRPIGRWRHLWRRTLSRTRIR